MRGYFFRSFTLFLMAFVFFSASLLAQQPPDDFHWVNFHSPKDQDVIVWVTHSLAVEKWTAIREIGVEYDAALVVTSYRDNPQAPVDQDLITVWTVSLSNHSLAPLLKAVNLHFFDWMLLANGKPRELAALYDSCSQCAADTFFTAFHYDIPQHSWAARWMRGGQAAPLWSANPPNGVTLTQVYAGLADSDGHQLLGTWSHFDYGKHKPAEDFLYRYDLDPYSGLERTLLISNRDAEAFKQRLCNPQSLLAPAPRGQDSILCQKYAKPHFERKPVTTPPANNHGQSVPPPARH